MTPQTPVIDFTRRFYLNAVRDAFLAMAHPLRRMPKPAWYELSRSSKNHWRQAWGSNVLTHLSEAIEAMRAEGKIDREALMAVPRAFEAFIDAKLAESPTTAESDMLDDMQQRAS